MSSNIPKVSVEFSNGNLLQNIPAIDGYAAFISSGTGSPLMPLNTPKIITSLADLETLKIFAAASGAVSAVAATGTQTITAFGVDGNTIDIQVAGLSITGGPVAKTASETTSALLATKVAAAVTAATLTNGGWTASAASGVITYTAPTALGDTVNTLYPIAVIVGAITTTHTAFTGGVSALMAMDNSKLYKEVKDFYQELAGNQELYIMLVADTVKMSEMLDYTDVNKAAKLIEFGAGKISKLGVFRKPDGAYAPGTNFFDADVLPAILASKSFVQYFNGKLKFLRVLIEGKIANEASTTILAPNTSSNGFAGVVLGDTVSGTGACVGTLLGRGQKYACHIKCGKKANGPLAAPAFYIGTKKVDEVTNLDFLHGKGVISLVTYSQSAGYYFGIDNMCSTDDYRLLVYGAVVDAAAKIAAAVYIEDLEGEVDTNPDGTIQEIDAKHLEDTVINQALTTLGDRISKNGVTAVVDRTVNIINTSKTKLKLRVRPKGYLTFIEVNLGLSAGN